MNVFERAKEDAELAARRHHYDWHRRVLRSLLEQPEMQPTDAVRRLGFHATTAAIVVEPGDSLRPAFMLERAATELTAVTVNGYGGGARLREFDERRAFGVGGFWTREQIDGRHAVSTVDILRESKATSCGSERC